MTENENMSVENETALTLKWGTLKGWNLENENKKCQTLMEEYVNIGVSFGCMMQDDTDRQKKIILELIDNVKGKIYLSWDGKYVSKDEAKQYIMNYGKEE